MNMTQFSGPIKHRSARDLISSLTVTTSMTLHLHSVLTLLLSLHLTDSAPQQGNATSRSVSDQIFFKKFFFTLLFPF